MRPRRGPPHGGSPHGGSPRGGPPSGSLLGARLRRSGRHPRSTHREFNKLTTVVLRAGAGPRAYGPDRARRGDLELGEGGIPIFVARLPLSVVTQITKMRQVYPSRIAAHEGRYVTSRLSKVCLIVPDVCKVLS